MVLKELEIQGFKSFPDRTRVKFDQGITAVVGPNGSGKSNISDAIRWVLGETSSKQLRGAGKMEDVIFGGTQLRSAMGYAMVNLTLDNSDRRLEVDADEVVIGRKYYRSGESEYSINGQNVRLKDVYELFLDTGLGRDGYSIIGQGRIAEIVGAKSAERREIFEEASGIAKYRYRKNEAERLLAGAEDNLARLRDILGELESRVGPLEKESKKAAQFLELSEKRKELEVTLWVDGVRRAKETVRTQQRQYETAQADYDALCAEIEAIDAETEQVQAEMQRLMVEVERCNAAIRAITEEQAGSDSRLAVLQNDIDHNNASIASFKEEIEAAGAGKEGLAAEAAAHRKAIEELEAKMAELEAEAARREEQLAAIQAENAATGERRGAVTGLLAQLTARQTDAKVRAASCASSAAAAAERLNAIAADKEKNAEALKGLEAEQADTAAYLATVNDTLARLENVQNGLKMKLASRTKQLDEADAAEQQITRQREAAVQRLQVLGDLERNMDGYQQSVKTVMRAAQNRRLRGILGTVSGLLTVQPGYELAIETALGFALQNIVVDGEAAAKAAIAFLRDEKAGRATFLPLDTVKGTRMDSSRLSGSARVAADLVKCDAKYDNIVANLLGRIIVVDEINEASRVARSLDWRNRVVTVDGQVINAGGSIFLDEVNLLTPTMQPKFLRVLQEREIDPVGGEKSIPIDVRVIAASNIPLESLVEAGEFRSDLYYRLNIICIRAPALRERMEDIPLLEKNLIERLNRQLGMVVQEISPDAMELLLQYDWPGNVRELQNATESAMNQCDGRVLRRKDFRQLEQRLQSRSRRHISGQMEYRLRPAKQAFERELIRDALAAAGGNRVKAAELLGISRTVLYEKLEKYQIK